MTEPHLIGKTIIERSQGRLSRGEPRGARILDDGRRLVAVLEAAREAIKAHPTYGHCTHEHDPGQYVTLVERIDRELERLRR